MNIKDLIVKWLKKHEICGNKAWWDGKTYYSLTTEQIRDIVNYVNKKNKHQGRRREMSKKYHIVEINDLMNHCGYGTSQTDANNGYGCDHPEQEETELCLE